MSRRRWIDSEVTEVRLRGRPPFIREVRRRKGAKRQGQLYEVKIHKIFEERYGARWLPGPWFEFRCANGSRLEYAQPDALLWHPADRRVVIVEIKFQHTTAGFEQLYGLYLPIVKAWLGSHWTVTLCEVVRWYRPEVKLPGAFVMAPDPDNRRVDSLSIHICNPSREKRRS